MAQQLTGGRRTVCSLGVLAMVSRACGSSLGIYVLLLSSYLGKAGAFSTTERARQGANGATRQHHGEGHTWDAGLPTENVALGGESVDGVGSDTNSHGELSEGAHIFDKAKFTGTG